MRIFRRRSEKLLHRFMLGAFAGLFVGVSVINNDNLTSKCQDTLSTHGKEVEHALGPRFGNGIIFIAIVSETSYSEKWNSMLHTWLHRTPADVEIFVDSSRFKTLNLSSNPRVKFSSLPIVKNPRIAGLKRQFMALQRIRGTYINNYEWFLILNDDTYVKMNELLILLRHADSKKPLYIGRPSKSVTGAAYGPTDYCLGESGVLLSQALLRRLGPMLERCMESSYTNRPDLELGRCVAKATGKECVDSWESDDLFMYNQGHEDIKRLSKAKRSRAMTLHLNGPLSLGRELHLRLLRDEITDLVTRITKLEIEMKQAIGWKMGKQFDIKGWNLNHDTVWDSISAKESSSSLDPSSGARSVTKLSVSTDVHTALEQLRQIHTLLKRAKIEEITVLDSTIIVNPVTSVDFIPRLKIRAVLQSHPITIRLKNLYYRKTYPFSFAFLKEDKTLQRLIYNKAQQQERVNFVVPLSGRTANFDRFLKNFEETFLSRHDNVSLTIVSFPAEGNKNLTERILDMDTEPEHHGEYDESTKYVRKYLQHIQERHMNFNWQVLPVMRGIGFSRGLGLQIGAERIIHRNAADEILFFCDVDLILRRDILTKIRRNTIRGKQAYYPIFFSQYSPDVVRLHSVKSTNPFDVDDLHGFWRTFSYGMVSLYKSDFLGTEGFDLSIKGWGLEDQKFCDAVMTKARLRIFRSNENDMVHVHHDKKCPQSLKRTQRHRCRKSRAQHFGSKRYLYRIWQRSIK